ncbi:hypothetical protein FHS27_003668 [Rhodopirellula rubra]|uniref:50S ribosomal protein L7/L12 n=1 Tax=Aporhodopirellula rubra TaxID=980271 RepID=A0A7W5E0C9_9BACT|nr:hypothetical protein [Aporhodopirellula rubra]MBB3207841.1 hypothetical protein [Aporhodopirellula rubra]
MSGDPLSNQKPMHWKGDAEVLEDLQKKLRWSLAMETPRKSFECSIRLLDAGKSPAKVVWAVRDQAGISLPEAKQLVESAPVNIPLPFSTPICDDKIQSTVRDAEWALHLAGARVETPPTSEWTVLPFEQDFMSLFPRLELLPNWKTIAQVYAGPREGFHRIWMLPPSAPSWETQNPLWEGERPVGARGIEEALRGDHSPQSYTDASVLIRVFGMVGSGWNEQEWNSHQIVSQPTDENWSWIQGEVRSDADLQPSVEIETSGNAIVTFFSVTRLNEVRLIRHRDRYRPGSYHPESEVLLCATGGQGYVY